MTWSCWLATLFSKSSLHLTSYTMVHCTNISKDLEYVPYCDGHIQCHPRRELTRDLGLDISFNGGTRALSPSDADAYLEAETCETMPATLLRKCNGGHATKTCNKDLWMMCDWIGGVAHFKLWRYLSAFHIPWTYLIGEGTFVYAYINLRKIYM